MLIEVAKAEYKKGGENRKRTPRNFTKRMTFSISSMQEGSVVLGLALSCAPSLVEPWEAESLANAGQIVAQAVISAGKEEPISEILPDKAIALFEEFGRGLQKGESIELQTSDPSINAVFTKDIRKHILLAHSAKKEYTEEISVRASVPDLMKTKNKITLLLQDDRKVPAPFDSWYEDVVLDAIRGPQDKVRVQVKGIGRFSHDGKLQEVESIDDIAILDPLDVGMRLEELSRLADGWLDGEGKAPSQDGLKWLTEYFDRYYSGELQLPYLCPTEEGGICAEWPLDAANISLEINLENRHGDWHAMDVANNSFTEKDLDLSEVDSWNWLCEQIKRKGGVS